jgi:hypothetical protein
MARAGWSVLNHPIISDRRRPQGVICPWRRIDHSACIHHVTISPEDVPRLGSKMCAACLAAHHWGMFMKISVRLLLLAATLISGHSFAQSYSYTTFGITAQWGGINNSDQVVSGGAYYSEVTSYAYSQGAFTTISSTDRGDFRYYAYGINNNGVIAGTLNPNYALNSGLLYQSGAFSAPITPISDANIDVTGINDLGQLVGTASGPGIKSSTGRVNVGFVLAGDSVSFIDAPSAGANGTELTGINNSGEIVGNTNVSAFLYRNGVYTLLAVPSQGTAHVTGINNVGDIVGWFNAYTPNSNAVAGTQGFIYNEHTGVYTIIPGPSNYTTKLFGINDHGDLVGSTSGTLFIASLSAVPEPSTVWLLITSFVCFGIVARKSRA